MMANALGVESVVVSRDQKAVLFRRSHRVSAFPGYYCCPGGHAEPNAVLRAYGGERSKKNIRSVHGADIDGGLPPQRPPPPPALLNDSVSQSKNAYYESLMAADVSAHASWHQELSGWLERTPGVTDLIVEELFDSALQETVDELGVDKSTLSNDGLLAVVADTMTGGKPDAIFLISCSLTFEEIRERFDSRRAAEAYESVERSLIGIDVKTMTEATLVGYAITPPSRACLDCCRAYFAA
jgi:hypothetical protein